MPYFHVNYIEFPVFVCNLEGRAVGRNYPIGIPIGIKRVLRVISSRKRADSIYRNMFGSATVGCIEAQVAT
jgi:hypothetical protein